MYRSLASSTWKAMDPSSHHLGSITTECRVRPVEFVHAVSAHEEIEDLAIGVSGVWHLEWSRTPRHPLTTIAS
jgi:dihydropteroate synthase